MRNLGCAAFIFVVAVSSQANASLQFGADLTNATTSATYYVGFINPGGGSEATEAGYVNNLITVAVGDIVNPGDPDDFDDGQIYNRVGGIAGPFDTATSTDSYKEEDKDATANTITLDGAIFKYIIAKYDQSSAGTRVWYFEDGVTGTVTVPGRFDGDTGQEVSHISAYNYAPIPEPASLLVWGGLVVAGVCVARRRMSK